jgi:phage shock protein PspC (stress-responsive transcriptional regulator)
MRDRLYRSRDERVVFGVAGGVSDWLDIDPTLVRLAFVLATVFGGAGLLIYIVMAIVVPEEPLVAEAPAAAPAAAGGETAATPGPAAPFVDARAARRAARAARRAERSGNGAVIFGAILVLVGGWFLARRAFPALDSDLLGPAILILIGILLIVGALNRAGNRPA